MIRKIAVLTLVLIACLLFVSPARAQCGGSFSGGQFQFSGGYSGGQFSGGQFGGAGVTFRDQFGNVRDQFGNIVAFANPVPNLNFLSTPVIFVGGSGFGRGFGFENGRFQRELGGGLTQGGLRRGLRR